MTDDLQPSAANRGPADIAYDPQALTHPGAIQAHGVLLVIDPKTLAIRAASANASTLFSVTGEDLLRSSLADLLTESEVEQIQSWHQSTLQARYSIVLSRLKSSLSIHQTENGWICEFEALRDQNTTDSFESLRLALEPIYRASSVQSLLNLAVHQCSQLSGFERAMVYRFDHQGAGEVVAEERDEEAIAYLGMHFPAADIPVAVRQLYHGGLIRYVPNLDAQFFNLVTDNPALFPPEQIDLRQSLLRSVDRCCVTYHQNMGVKAFIVMPLCIDQTLWGLLALHHSQLRYLSLQQREMLSLIGQSISLALGNALKQESLAYEAYLKRLQSELIRALSESNTFEEVLIQPTLKLPELVQAQGVAICLSRGITLIGDTPDGDQVLELLTWAQTQVTDFIFATDRLPLIYEPARQYQNRAAGVLLLNISAQLNVAILWFRQEQKQLVNWAGNPSEPMRTESDGNFGPRQSFENWQEIIQSTSKPWLESEIENARGLRAAISGIALRRADELARINQELEQSNEELASFAYAASHDLKEPLRGIYNYTTFLIEDYADLLDDAGIDRMQALLRLTKRMDQLIDALLKFAQMRQADFVARDVDLHGLVESVVDMIRISRGESAFSLIVPRPLPTIESDPVLLQELFSNLISNALKYNESTPKTIEIGYLNSDEQQKLKSHPLIRRGRKTLFYVCDNGIGIKLRHQKSIFRLFKRLHARDRYGGGTGAGLTIVKKIVERHGG
ncbi:MAG: ATP-binding protein, partial [Cyanobacteria bacterium P01_F01_bin.42]